MTGTPAHEVFARRAAPLIMSGACLGVALLACALAVLSSEPAPYLAALLLALVAAVTAAAAAHRGVT